MRKKIAVVTGASPGIARTIACELTASFNVVLNYATAAPTRRPW